MDAQIGGAYLYGIVTTYLRDQVGPRLFGGAGGGDGAAVFTSAAALTEMAGWMAHESGRDADARRHFHRGGICPRSGQTDISVFTYSTP